MKPEGDVIITEAKPEIIMTSPEDSNLRRNLYCRCLTGLTKWLKHDLLHASLLEESLFLRSLALQELLGHVLQVPVSAPSGSANDYAGFIVKEDIDLLLLKASQ